MKVIIAGDKNIKLAPSEIGAIVKESGFNITILVSGTSCGIDRSGMNWAHRNLIPIAEFPTEWGLHGKEAGPIRNNQMVQVAQGLILIWDGWSADSRNMLDNAYKRNLLVHEHRIDIRQANAG